MLSDEQGRFLVSLARRAIETYLKEKRLIDTPDCDEELRENAGAFVTLKASHDVLRGCIGRPYPNQPLVEAIIDSAVSAAVTDPRFKRLTIEELPATRIEVTVLSPPVLLEGPRDSFPKQVEIGKHGLMIIGQKTCGLLLPQVASDVGMSSTEFLEAVCWKAGIPPQSWKDPANKIYVFEGRVFKE